MDKKVCEVSEGRNVFNITAGACTLPGGGCDMLARIRNECSSTKDPHCVREPTTTISTTTKLRLISTVSKVLQNAVLLGSLTAQTLRNEFFELKGDPRSPKAIFEHCPSGSTPVTIHSEAHDKEIASLNRGVENCVVTGLRIAEGEDWSKNGFCWISNSPLDYTNWNTRSPQPTNEGALEYFVVIANKAYWSDRWAGWGANYFVNDRVDSIACMVPTKYS